MPTAVAAARQSYADHPMVRLETAPPGPCHAVSLQETPSDPCSTSATVILVLQDASDDSVLTLDPTFDSATLGYGTTVGRDVGEITIIPTPNDTDADYEIQDGDGTALTDADTTQGRVPGFHRPWIERHPD